MTGIVISSEGVKDVDGPEKFAQAVADQFVGSIGPNPSLERIRTAQESTNENIVKLSKLIKAYAKAALDISAADVADKKIGHIISALVDSAVLGDANLPGELEIAFNPEYHHDYVEVYIACDPQLDQIEQDSILTGSGNIVTKAIALIVRGNGTFTVRDESIITVRDESIITVRDESIITVRDKSIIESKTLEELEKELESVNEWDKQHALINFDDLGDLEDFVTGWIKRNFPEKVGAFTAALERANGQDNTPIGKIVKDAPVPTVPQ